ncbi:O-antigen polymerase [uncultured Muribaculum sp.]|uniref:O-antigen polymerase n=1 Tax=uncultured Muribaculum sp. TaxID=1918613 RepID=UPI002598F7E4|nr:O-antigen polymerase [uncultured Muribaculum sp.]
MADVNPELSVALGVLLGCVFLLLCGISYKKFKSLIAPGVVVPFVWGSLLLLYNLLDTPLYRLSNSLYFLVTLWVVSFTFSANFFSCIKLNKSFYKYRDVNRSVLSLYLIIVLICTPLIILRMIKMGGSDINMFFIRLRLAQAGMIDEVNYGILRYPMTLAVVVFLIELYRNKTSKGRIGLLLILNVLFIFAVMAKTQFFWVVFPSVAILYFASRLSKKYIYWICSICLILFTAIQIVRGGENSDGLSVGDAFMQIYVLGGMPALDQIIDSGEHSTSFGYYTLSFFRKILGFVDSKESNILITIFNEGRPGYAYVPVPTNVYTAIFSSYLDFGYIGASIFAIIYGMFAGILYKLAKREVIWAIIGYGYIFATLVFQFYSDAIFVMFSQFIQFCLFPFIACYFSYQLSIGKFSLKKWSP